MSTDLLWRLGLIDNDFRDKMVNAGAVVEGVGSKFAQFEKGLAGGAVLAWAKSTMDSADAIKAMADNLEIGTDQLQAFAFAVRGANGTNEDANRIWTTTRGKLDELRAATPAAIELFAKLGLTASDFKGLALDESLVKISRAYAENADRAGAYATFQDIVGRGGRNLTGVLVELGEKGMGTFIEKANEAHAIIGDKVLGDLAEMKRRFDENTNVFKTGSAYILDFVARLSAAIGVMAGVLFMFQEASAKGGIFSAAGREQLKASLAAAAEEMKKIVTGASLASDHTATAKKNLDGSLPPLKEARALVEERAKYEEIIAKSMTEGANSAVKLVELMRQIKEHEQKAKEAGDDKITAQKEMNKAAELMVQYMKELRASEAAVVEMTLKRLEAWRAEVPLWEQSKILALEMEVIAENLKFQKQQHLDTTKLENEALAVGARQMELKKALANDQLKTLSDLLSKDLVRNEQAKIHLKLLDGTMTSMEVQREAEMLLVRGAENLNEQEKIRLAALVDQMTPIQKQAQITAILQIGVENLTDADKARLAVLLGQVTAIENQNKKLREQVGLITRTGANYSDQSTQSLEYVARSLKKQLDAARLEDSTNPYGSLFNSQTGLAEYGMPAQVQQELINITRELGTRNAFASDIRLYGEARTRGLFAPDEFERLMKLVSGSTAAQQTADTLAEINQRISFVFPKNGGSK